MSAPTIASSVITFDSSDPDREAGRFARPLLRRLGVDWAVAEPRIDGPAAVSVKVQAGSIAHHYVMRRASREFSGIGVIS